MEVFAELNEDHTRIEVHFDYHRELVSEIKKIPGRQFVPKERGGPHWTIPAQLESARALRRAFGSLLELGAALDAWGRKAVAQESALVALGSARSAHLERLPRALPALYEAVHLGPMGRFMTPAQRKAAMKKPASFQAADVAFMSVQQNPLNGNHQGLGKTIEIIAAIFESGTDDGANLVIAPATALETVWQDHLEAWQPHKVFVAIGSAKQRQGIIDRFVAHITAGNAGWLVINPDMVRFRSEFELCSSHGGETNLRVLRKCRWCNEKMVSAYPEVHAMKWNNIVLDEVHKNAVRNTRTLTAKGMFALDVVKGGKRIAASGTPMGGRAINLFGILQWLNPAAHKSKWRWARQWLAVTHNGFGYEIGDVRPEVEDDFNKHLQQYMIRRTKDEVIKELPPKQYIDVWCAMGAKQGKQYKTFAKKAEVGVKDGTISAVNVLSEYTRLKQMANAYHDIKDGKVVPTLESGKLDALIERLDELGIFDEDGEEQAVIFSQFSEIVDLITAKLVSMKVPVLKITGEVNKRGARAEAQRTFQAGKARVMVMTTTAGGVAITLDMANTVHILDETWNPDDQEQAEDRVHRASRIHQVTVYRYRSKGTIDEYIKDITEGKGGLNKKILDDSRQGKLKLYD